MGVGKGREEMEGDEGGKKCRNEWKIMQFTPVRSVVLVSQGHLTDRAERINANHQQMDSCVNLWMNLHCRHFQYLKSTFRMTATEAITFSVLALSRRPRLLLQLRRLRHSPFPLSQHATM